MSRNRNLQDKNYSTTFICEHCRNTVTSDAYGTFHRNHCPHCLFSKHVDHRTGDRLSVCKGLMHPIGIWSKDDGETAIIHRCTKCGIIRTNRIAGDDNINVISSIINKTKKSIYQIINRRNK